MLTKVEVRRADGGHPTEWFPFYVGVTEPNGCDQHGGQAVGNPATRNFAGREELGGEFYSSIPIT